VDPDQPGTGLSIEVVREALATQGLSLTVSVLPWVRAELAVREGTIDLLPDTWMTADRARDYLYSDPYLVTEIRFLKRKGDPFEYTGLSSLRGKRVGIIRGYGYDEAFLFDPGFQRIEANDFLANIRNLLAGRIDLTLEEPFVAAALLKKTDPALLAQVQFVQNPHALRKIHVVVGFRNPRAREIVDAFNRGLSLLTANGRLAEILGTSPGQPRAGSGSLLR
jgi:polar amino acid transport system substrate-binding protein